MGDAQSVGDSGLLPEFLINMESDYHIAIADKDHVSDQRKGAHHEMEDVDMLVQAIDPIILDDNVVTAEENIEMVLEDDNTLKEFTLFPVLPIELRLAIWNHAFPPRIVNLVYCEARDAHFTFNSRPPLLLQIHRETREIALSTHRQFFLNESEESSRRPIWIDCARDIVFLKDDYLDSAADVDMSVAGGRKNIIRLDKCISPYNNGAFQNVAIPVFALPFLDNSLRIEFLQAAAAPTVARFPALKNLYVVYENGVNPYSQGRIRFFPMERTCSTDCESRGCINLALKTAEYQDAVDRLRVTKLPSAKGVSIHFVGAWRGGSRAEFGHALDGFEDESDDEYDDSGNDPEDGYASDSSMKTPDEIKGRVRFGGSGANGFGSGILYWDEADSDVTFSDHEGWTAPEVIPEQELRDLVEDEKDFKDLLGTGHNPVSYESNQGKALSLIMRNPEDYYKWRQENCGKCYPIFHPDGTYRAF